MDANMCQIDVNMYMRANQHHVKHSAQFLLVIYVVFFVLFFVFHSPVMSQAYSSAIGGFFHFSFLANKQCAARY